MSWYYYIIILILDHKQFSVFFSGELYLSLGFSLYCSFVTVSGLFCYELFKTSPVASAVFGIALFELVLSVSARAIFEAFG